MVSFRTLIFAASTVCFVAAAPLNLEKRIAQVIADSTQKWEQSCARLRFSLSPNRLNVIFYYKLAAGGADKCNPLSITAFSSLLAGGGDCDQQNAADAMMDLAKTLKNNQDMIKLTQIFAQQPRNSPNSLSVPYCQKTSKNSELNGLFQCQFEGVDAATFVGNLKVGAPGTIPFGKKSAVQPPKSCPAHTSGGVADGTQLVAITQNPGV